MSWESVLPVSGSRYLQPDPGVMEAIGLNHALETAVADLVDNSIDAGARRVLIRFVRNSERLEALCVLDDGKGMSGAEIDSAMTVGERRSYGRADLGHFGVGLKAASLGQADCLVVLTRAEGERAVGRRWLIHKATKGFECDDVNGDFASKQLDSDWGFLTVETGTLVRWDGVRSFPASLSQETTDRYLEETILHVRQHLGLVYHRLLEAGRVTIGVDVQDISMHETGPLYLVDPIDPFGYIRSGSAGYPKVLVSASEEGALELQCHIWPGRSQLTGFKIPGIAADRGQGFYFYRNDRLLQAGGWNGVVHPERHLQLARVAVNIDDSTAEMFVMNPEKTRVHTREAYASAVRTSSGVGGFELSTFLDDAALAFKEANRRSSQRPSVLPAGKGFTPKVRKAIGGELNFIPGEAPVDIRWTDFGSDSSLFEISHDERVIKLNKAYRSAVVGEGRASLNDAPLVKALLYLLMENLFRGAYLGVKDKDNIELWQAILTPAARSESQ